jgi:putative transcriptional regulator
MKDQVANLQKNDIQFFLGYSGWDKEQLSGELQENTWVVAENDLGENYLSTCCPDLWREKILQLGGDYLIWSNAPENPNLN